MKIIQDNLDFNDLKFYVSRPCFDHKKVERWNIFDHFGVKWAVAKYIIMSDKERQRLFEEGRHSALLWCFGDYWSRTEYEMIISPWPYKNEQELAEKATKYDIYTLYIEPNEELLMEMIHSVNKETAKKWLAGEARRRKQEVQNALAENGEV